MESIKISTNEIAASKVKQAVNKLVREAQWLVDKVVDINRNIKITKEMLDDAILRDGNLILNEIISNNLQSLQMAGINSKAIKDAAIEGDNSTFRKIRMELNFSNNDFEEVELLQIKDNKVSLIQDAYQIIDERFSNYIRTQKGVDKYNEAKDLAEKINKLASMCNTCKPGDIITKLIQASHLGPAMVNANWDWDRL